MQLLLLLLHKFVVPDFVTLIKLVFFFFNLLALSNINYSIERFIAKLVSNLKNMRNN